jgi:hypothetical protein
MDFGLVLRRPIETARLIGSQSDGALMLPDKEGTDGGRRKVWWN